MDCWITRIHLVIKFIYKNYEICKYSIIKYKVHKISSSLLSLNNQYSTRIHLEPYKIIIVLLLTNNNKKERYKIDSTE